MAEEQVSDKQLIEALLRERDELYRRATKAEHRLAELSDAEAMRQQYEARIKEKDNEMRTNTRRSFPRRRTRYVTSCAAWNTWLASYGAG